LALCKRNFDKIATKSTLTDAPVSGQNQLALPSHENTMSNDESIRMSVSGLTLDPATKSPIVILKDAENTLNLPIWIGLLEATAIATELEGIEMARPMTHDLLRDMIGELGARVEQIEISDLKDNTYYAKIHIRIGDGARVIDSRPSDAISLALRVKSPIYVAKKVLEESQAVIRLPEPEDSSSEGGDLSTISRDKWGEILEKMSPGDFKYKM
jgi:bifunctional DNase/RNase